MTETLADIGEKEAIRRLCGSLRTRDDVVQGVGDDGAVLRSPSGELDIDWVLTSDPVIEGVHFLHRDKGGAVGHKAVGRVLSDLAAMGAEPRWALIDIAAPPDTPVDLLTCLVEKARALADRHQLLIAGGDTSEATALQVHVFGVGTVPRGKAILRTTARSDDSLYVTGSLGGSRLGRHLAFEPRVEQGIWLRDWATALIDISDGLATDLRHLTESSEKGALLQLDAVPVSDAAHHMNDGLSALDHALRDGEDFELLFTVPADKARRFESAWSASFDLTCTRIGVMTQDAGQMRAIRGNGTETDLSLTGFEHFGPEAA